MRQIGQEGFFVGEAAEVEHQPVFLDPSDHRRRQRAQPVRQVLDRAAARGSADGKTRALNRLERKRAGSDLASALTQLDCKRVTNSLRDMGQSARRTGLDFLSRSREEPHGRQTFSKPVGVSIELQGGLDRRQPDLVELEAPAS